MLKPLWPSSMSIGTKISNYAFCIPASPMIVEHSILLKIPTKKAEI